ncbi:peptide chain release factor N(5)-glutamine methyltransferase [Rhodoligotrophos defluvii]|uniref:peptide chain release factor N(5)-glutamine methyltransferase n=1 Tax=Rhodoligotrophos defluvii TaxID=2561934 RepID=UPI0010C9818D|nr:peptide chain release factor N(5)-glutamine methyltransferase [Rhodoligotrophos defluvii]
MNKPPADAARTLGTLFRWGRDRLREHGVDTPDLDARLLLLEASGIDHTVLIAAPDRAMAPEEAARFAELLKRRCAGEPVSRILGYREFHGHWLALSAATLDPRPETELVVDQCLRVVDLMGWRHSVGGRPLRLLDLGTGTGAIVISLLHALPGAWGCAVDIAYEALATARGNAARLGVGDRLALACGNWTDAFSGRFDVILSNPPYIETSDIGELKPEVRCFDPVLALDGGQDGLAAYRRIIPSASQLLVPGGWLILEVGAGQAAAVIGLCRTAGFGPHAAVSETVTDLAGHARVVCMQLGWTT